MEKRLKFVLLLSLKEMSLRRVAVPLCCDSVGESVSSDIHLFNNEVEEWREEIEYTIKERMLGLCLPESLTKQMIEIIRPVISEIKKWVGSHENYFIDSHAQSRQVDLTKLCWTAAGSVDNRKTAEKLVRCDVLEIEQRYNLACLYCLEEDIPRLWEGLPDLRKVYYYSHKPTEPHLSYCWPYILKGELSKLNYFLRAPDRNPFTFYQCAFEYFAEKGHKAAAKYFFLKLSPEFREDSFVRTVENMFTEISNMDIFEYFEKFPKEKYSNFLFLVSLMDPEQQMEVAESLPIEILFSFLDWPWRDLFLENIGLIWTLIPSSSYGELLGMMYDRYAQKDSYIPKLFQELLVQSPLGFKKCFVDEEPELEYEKACKLISQLLDSDDAETLGVIFRSMDAVDRSKLFFQPGFIEELYECVMLGSSWPVVYACLREAKLSKEDQERLKGTFREFLKNDDSPNTDWEKENLKNLFEFLDGSGKGRKRAGKGRKRTGKGKKCKL